MTARTPRTMTAEREAKARKFSSNTELMFTWDIWAELDAEREVSRKLAEALYVHHDTSTCMWCNRYNDNYKHPCKAKAALAQYTATPLASSEGLPTDTGPSQGGRD